MMSFRSQYRSPGVGSRSKIVKRLTCVPHLSEPFLDVTNVSVLHMFPHGALPLQRWGSCGTSHWQRVIKTSCLFRPKLSFTQYSFGIWMSRQIYPATAAILTGNSGNFLHSISRKTSTSIIGPCLTILYALSSQTLTTPCSVTGPFQ